MTTLESTNNLTKGYAPKRSPVEKLREIQRSRDYAQKLIEALDKEKEKIIESLNLE